MLAPVTHLLPLANIRRERLLPVNGRVIVRAGQKVNATDVIAEARLATEHLVLEVARGLGLPADKADKLVDRKVGEDVAEGDVIAGPVGVFARAVRAPKPGRIVAIGGGQVLLELVSRPYELRAGLSGMVTELVPDRGAIIECNGALIQGVWGNNLIEGGILTVLARNPGDELLSIRLDVSMRGAIVLGGPCTQADVIRTAAEIPLRALILSSLTPDLFPVVSQVRMPVLVLNGIGKVPMDDATYKILSTNDKRGICVNAAPWNRYNRTRPELVIPLPSSGQLTPPREADIFAPGQTVRVVQSPNRGAIATIVTLRPGVVAFPSGIRMPSAILQMENGEKATFALANLEVIE
jgi:hypothetical protein